MFKALRGLFKSVKDKKAAATFVYDQAVILEVNFAHNKLYDSNEAYKAIKELEDTIALQLPEKSDIDGDDMATDEAIIYIYGPSADAIFKVIEPLLKKSRFDQLEVTLQYGLPDDPSTKDKKFTL
jgi:hypothetical protein